MAALLERGAAARGASSGSAQLTAGWPNGFAGWPTIATCGRGWERAEREIWREFDVVLNAAALVRTNLTGQAR